MLATGAVSAVASVTSSAGAAGAWAAGNVTIGIEYWQLAQYPLLRPRASASETTINKASVREVIPKAIHRDMSNILILRVRIVLTNSTRCEKSNEHRGCVKYQGKTG
jgi:hypothetical protein